MLRSADQHYATVRALAQRAAREARKGELSAVVVRHQAAAALVAAQGVTAMLAEQRTPVTPDAELVPTAFVTPPVVIDRMAAEAREGWRIERLVLTLVADAARGGESVSIATRPRVGYVRYVSPPSCSRCAILAGRFYRWSDGFLRHPGCDCTHLPTTDPRSAYRQNPHDLVDQGLVTGLSKADRRALADGADLNQVVNVRGKRAGLRDSGEVLSRAGRPTPAGIYRMAGGDRDKALSLLAQHGYIR